MTEPIGATDAPHARRSALPFCEHGPLRPGSMKPGWAWAPAAATERRRVASMVPAVSDDEED